MYIYGKNVAREKLNTNEPIIKAYISKKFKEQSIIDELKKKNEFKSMIDRKYFKRYIVLSKDRGLGTIEGVYNENLNRIYGATI